MELNKGDVAVITGGASGLGFGLASALGRRGLRLCLIDVEASALAEAVERLQAEGADAEAFVGDVSDAAAMSALANEILARHGRVDLLINNAGVSGLLGPIPDSPAEDWAWVFGVNVFGVVNGIRAFAPAMRTRASGHILNIASLAGLTAPPFLAPYVASKHAVVALTECLATEFAVTNAQIGVSVACPANVESRIHSADRNRPAAYRAQSSAPPEMLERLRAAIGPIMAQGLISADEAAERILAGVERNDLYILTHPDENGHARDRLARLGAALA